MKKIGLTTLLLLSCLNFGNSTLDVKDYTRKQIIDKSDLIRCLNKTRKIKYLRDNVRYSNLKNSDYYQSPKETDSLGTGDCEDKAIYLCNLLKEKNINSVLRFGRLEKNRKNVSHFWLEIENGDTTYLVEPTAVYTPGIYILDKFPIKGNVPDNLYEYSLGSIYAERKVHDYEARTGQKLNLQFPNRIKSNQ